MLESQVKHGFEMKYGVQMMPRRVLIAVIAVLVLTTGPALTASAQSNTSAFQRTWDRTDRPVAEGLVSRTWMWGPQSNTGIISESYVEAPGGQRQVLYFDKSRMEITNPDGDPSNPWYVTNGLLVVELVTGRLQLGEDTFEQYDPAVVNVAGDPGDPNAPTYATFGGLLDAAPLAEGSVISRRVDRAGTVTDDPEMAGYGVTAVNLVSETNHTVASVFWDLMTSSGLVYQDGQLMEAPLFQNPFYATGLPITEAYWTTVQVAGEPRNVLVQAFERRVLTYTPGNPEGFEVEAGNVGLHYYHWRYEVLSSVPPPVEGDVITAYDLTQVPPEGSAEAGYQGAPTDEGYGFTLAPDYAAIVMIGEQNFDDVSFSIETRVTDPAPAGQACLDSRLMIPSDQSSPDGSDYSLCLNYALSEDGTTTEFVSVNLSYFDGETFTSLGTWELSPGIVATDWHTLKLIAQGQRFWVGVDGEIVVSLAHAGAPSGRVGFSAVDSTSTVTESPDPSETSLVEFRNLVVRAIR